MSGVLRTGRSLTLPGRSAIELASGEQGGYETTVRRVTIPPGGASQARRGPHRHDSCEEIMIILSGAGELRAEDETWAVAPGDVVVVSRGALHRTRNTGSDDLVLLCVLPVADVAGVTHELDDEPASWSEGDAT
ncbi:MAG TPA: cupin domain-containing protein [Solirubrobacteraceae bacterium]|nr:cupin domain-containing protein [Solirubrobacteraceae bacterium]